MTRTLTAILAAVAALAIPALAAMPAIAQDMAVVSTRVVYPGETIGPDAIEMVPLRRTTMPAAPIAQDFTAVQGKVARRTLLPGRLIAVSSLREAFLVESGKLVNVVFEHGGLTISMRAVPLESGSIGAAVKLRNIDSGKVFSGVIMADGTVRVSG
ncbi:MAG: flagellar basal body P-ring formation chaperone FlgA [Mesorhizobium sp.]